MTTTRTILCAAFALLRAADPAGAAAAADPAGERRFELAETIVIPAPETGQTLRAWIPLPQELPAQTVSDLDVDSPLPYRVERDGEFGNSFLVLEPRRPVTGPVTVTIRYAVTRREQGAVPATLSPEERRLYTQPRGLVVVDKRIRSLARRITAGAENPEAKGRRIYDYVYAHMAYDKTAPGWGQGDTQRACEVGKGNCTDFHSLFMSLAFASGLPARFTMGLSISTTAAAGSLGKSYHCWAEFYADGKGWIPVDISEAWKDPARKEYFFGRLDAQRITLSRGRELTLEPAQEWKPLNYFAYPYVEVGGRPSQDVKFERTYKIVAEKS